MSLEPHTGNSLVIYIHGLNDYDRDRNLELLTEGLQSYMTKNNLGFEAEWLSGERGGPPNRFRHPRTGRTVDIEMVYWGDLRRSFSAMKPLDKLLKGFSMLVFWTVSPLWGQMLRTQQSRLLAGIVFTLMVFGVWYLSTLIIVAATPEQLPEFVQGPAVALAETVKSAWIWIGAVLLLQIIPANLMMDVVYSVQCYLREPAFRSRVQARLARSLARADAAGVYDEIVVLAHSFGTVVAAEVLDTFRFTAAARVVTLGSPIEVVAARDRTLRDALAATARNETLRRWDDVISDQDWLCTPVPAPRDVGNFRSRPLSEKVDFAARLSGASHEMYFHSDEVHELILGTGHEQL